MSIYIATVYQDTEGSAGIRSKKHALPIMYRKKLGRRQKM